MVKEMNVLGELLKKYSTIGLVGNRNTGKTLLLLNQFIQLRKDYPNLKMAVIGLNPELEPVLDKYNILNLNSKMDILDLQLTDYVIGIDEMALFFDTQSKSKQLSKLQRFYDRIEHNNCKLIVGTAREGYFNKFMCSRIVAFIIKQIEYDALVNGTWLKERVKAITSISDYRLVADKNEYYIVTAGDGTLTSKHTFEYSSEIDTKKKNKDLFCETKDETKDEIKDEIKKSETKYPIGVM